MITRVMMIGLLVLSAVAMMVTDASAQIGGWAFRGYSAVTGVIDLEKVRGLKNLNEVTIAGSLNLIEVACAGPQGQIVNGAAGSALVSATETVGSEDITDKDGNKATVEIVFGSAELAAVELQAAQNGVCRSQGSGGNESFTVVPESAAPKAMILTVTWTQLMNSGLIVRDSVDLMCGIDPVLRDAGGLPLHDQEIACVEV